MSPFTQLKRLGKVVPVLSFSSETEAVEGCTALFDAGIRVFEITLRHPTAIEQIRTVKYLLGTEALVGAGTVTTVERAQRVRDAGADFGVSPGSTKPLLSWVREAEWSFLPGVGTITEAMSAADEGFVDLKFFPAEQSGGIGFLKAAAAVLPDLHFCPTGGLSPKNAADYLALPNVPVIGGSWMMTRQDDGKLDLRQSGIAARKIVEVFNP